MEEYWNYHNLKMIELKRIYNRINQQLQKDLQYIFDSFYNVKLSKVHSEINNLAYESLFNFADFETKKRLQAEIDEMNENGLLNGYIGIWAKNIYKKSKVKNCEILEFLIYSAYIKEQNKLEKYEKEIMYDDANYYYKLGQKEVDEKKDVLSLSESIFLLLMSEPIYNGLTRGQYVDTTIKYNAQQIYRQAIINIQQQKELKIDSSEFKNTIIKQNNQKLYINSEKISGATDIQMIGLDNLAKVEGIKSIPEGNSEDAKVRFIAIEDENTTKMCQSLDGQEFFINKENVFERYYGENPKELKIERIRCLGLVPGINLPPILHHYHYCRSTIVYNTNYTNEDFRNGNVLGEEQYKALEQYIKSMSYKINSKLYNNEKLSKEDKEYIENLDNALKGMPIYKGWVRRSIYVRDNEDVSKILSIFDNEQKIGFWNSYISASTDIYDGSFGVQMKIKSKTGRNLTTLNNNENEVLFARNTNFQLIDIKAENGIIFVKIEEV